MRRGSNFRGMCVWLTAAILLLAAASADAGRLNVREVVKRVIPRVGQQLSRVAVDGKVAITAACVAAACVINFATPAEAVSADFLSPDAELAQARGTGDIFARGSSTIGKTAANYSSYAPSNNGRSTVEKMAASPGLSFSHWVGKGVYHNSGNNFGTIRIGTTAKTKSFSAYQTTSFRYHPDTTDGIDDIGIKTVTYAGARMLLIDNGDGGMSYGYVNTDALVGRTRVFFRNARGYLLRYHDGPVQIAGLGYEYVDNDLNLLANPGESADSVRSHGVALYRAGINYPLTDLFTSGDALAVNLKLSSAMHLGDIGPVKLGETWQGELNDWAGEDADLDHMLYHTAGGSINVSFADGRVNLILGGYVQHTIDGVIKRPMEADGDFDIRNVAISVGGTVDLLPDDGISLVAVYNRHDQSTDANLDDKRYDNEASGTWARVVARKAF